MVWASLFRGTTFVCLVALATIETGRAETAFEGRNFPEATNDSTYRDKVKVELYYMPQCPGCRQLITTSFDEAFNTPGFSNMADVTFVPYGEKRRSSQGQEKQKRVFDNILESCALHTIGRRHQDQQFAYINCIDHYNNNRNARDPFKVDRACARAIGLSEQLVRDIETCAVSEQGHALAERNVQQSESTRLGYFPWIVVEREHTSEIENAVWESLFDYVCEIYSGPKRSQECPAGENDDGDFDDEFDDDGDLNNEFDDDGDLNSEFDDDGDFESEFESEFHDGDSGNNNFGGVDENFAEQL